MEHPLNKGDEIGIGNITVDSSDCFVYIVHQDSSVQNLPLVKTVEGKQFKQVKNLSPDTIEEAKQSKQVNTVFI